MFFAPAELGFVFQRSEHVASSRPLTKGIHYVRAALPCVAALKIDKRESAQPRTRHPAGEGPHIIAWRAHGILRATIGEHAMTT